MELEHTHLESLYPETSRYAEIEQILEYVKRGDSCQIIAMPGVGRGNLLRFLAYNKNIRLKHLGEKQTNYHFVFVNFDEIKRRPVIDALKFIFLELVSSLRERRWDEAFETTNSLFKDALRYHDELVLVQGLKNAIDYLAAEQQKHIVLLFERFEKYLPMLTADFFTYLKSLRNKAKYKFSVVFSTTRQLEETVETQILSDFYEYFAGHEVYLTLCDDPGIRFRIHYLEELTTQSLGEDWIENLLKLTAGHGKLTRLSVEYMLSQQIDPISQQELSPVFTANPPIQKKLKIESEKLKMKVPFQELSTSELLSQKTIQTACKEIWDFLTPEEQQFILASSKEKTDFLEKVHLMESGQITLPLFSKYLTTQSPQTHEEPITYDPLTNTIKKGSFVISDRLTSSEFRLLRYLIENPTRVLEREQIITAVWKDTASTLGVTDQALDQLIFRLRKKIEDNPNNPMHIQTVKGRGVQFTP